MEHFLEQVKKPDNIPIVGLIFLIIFYTVWAFKQAFANDKSEVTREMANSEKVQTWPNLVKVEFVAAIVVMLLLTVWSIAIDAPLEEPANPSKTPNPSKAPWYFLGLQELLVYFDPWIAGVVLPSIIIIGLMAIPYIDFNEKGNGYYTYKERKLAIWTFCFGFLVLWITLIISGTFLRGPGWNWFAPWNEWDTHKVVALTNVDLSELFRIRDYTTASIFGGIVTLGYFGIGTVLPLKWFGKKQPELLKTMGMVRYFTISSLYLMMFGVVIKIILRVTLNIKYIWVTPWFNI
ncbi:cytochrome C [bacterium]|nr:cytochrome C [bacterium]